MKNALAAIEKQFGKGAIMQLGERPMLDVPGHFHGRLSLDIALGGKGLPRGRIIEIFGPESSGKTTVALHTIANAQKQGGVAAFIDAEHALDPSWAKRLGVDLEGLLVSQPSNGEEALKIAEMLVKSNAVDIIVIDSVAALVPRAEVEGEIGDSHVGLQARLMSQALRIFNPTITRTKTCMIFINQIRQKIGVMFGNPETTSGGLALKFYCSVRWTSARSPTSRKAKKRRLARQGAWSRTRWRRRSAGRVRPDARSRHQPGGRPDRPGHRGQADRQERLLAQLRRNPPGPGPGKRQAISARKPGSGRGDYRKMLDSGVEVGTLAEHRRQRRSTQPPTKQEPTKKESASETVRG